MAKGKLLVYDNNRIVKLVESDFLEGIHNKHLQSLFYLRLFPERK